LFKTSLDVNQTRWILPLDKPFVKLRRGLGTMLRRTERSSS